jgi:iron only hydrogenase large subunit-like protein
LFGQFRQLASPEQVVAALLHIGFDEIFEVPLAADYVTHAVQDYIALHGAGPWISASCPAVVRLIQVRYPELIKYIIPVESPMEVAAFLARKQAAGRLGLEEEQIGVWFITPCAAKVTAIHQPEGLRRSNADGAFAIKDLYGDLLRQISLESVSATDFRASGIGLGWGRAGGENIAVAVENHLAVDGVHSLISLFDEMEMGKLRDICFLECQACIGGCVGGALTVENPFVARVRLRKLAESLHTEVHTLQQDYADLDAASLLTMHGRMEPRPIMPLDADMLSAIRKMEQLEKINDALPGLDCGACGSPNCRALAEDIVRGIANETDCVIKLRERVRDLASEMLDLAEKLPPAMGQEPVKGE